MSVITDYDKQCTECPAVFEARELRADNGWGHPCRMSPHDPLGMRCESHLRDVPPDTSVRHVHSDTSAKLELDR